ncbi:hypothetical protein LCGC14_2992520, partial [marine sediment metagenome]
HGILFNDLVDISDIPLAMKRQVSIGFDDEIVGDTQYIRKVDHLAMSLDNDEMGKCLEGGKDCFMEVKTDMIEDIEEGRWITIRGTHVFIKKGQTTEEAIRKAFEEDLKWKKIKYILLYFA